jgi:small-conductance mechanosensitive channel/CRP-like cAMP-binding protein
MGRSSIRTIAVPAAVLFVMMAALQFHVEGPIVALTGMKPHSVVLSLGVLGWITGAVLTCRLTKVLVWRQMGRSSGREPPQLLIQLTNVLIYFATGLCMAAFLFNISLTGAIATSSVIGLVIGFAVKSLISDTFSGIALNLDQGFGIDDFIQLIGRAGTAKIVGRVVQINWRSTYILTPENSLMVIPNTVVSEAIVLNLSKPATESEFELVVTLDFEVPPERAVRVLNAAVQAASRENPAIFDCKARVSEVNLNGVNYKIKYMLNPAKLGPGKAKHFILSHVLRQMTMTGLSLAHPKIDNWSRETPEMTQKLGDAANRLRLLKHVDLFRQIEEDDLADLAGRMSQRIYAPGSHVITVGEPGASMFVLSEGLVTVRINTPNGELDVATLSPGDFFGEMSLLTGEPRSASIIAVAETVAFEIDKEALIPLLDAAPNAAAILSAAVAARKVATSVAGSAKPPEEIAAERSSLAGKILSGMMGFLGRKNPKPELAMQA